MLILLAWPAAEFCTIKLMNNKVNPVIFLAKTDFVICI